MNIANRHSVILATLFLSANAAADARLDEIRQRVDTLFPQIEGELVAYAPMPGWVSIQKGSIVAYMSEDGRYLMQGDLIDLERNVNVSEDTRNHARRNLVAGIGDDQVIAFTPAKVRHSITVFTDVDCGYCRRLHNQIDEYLAHGIEVRYLLYPRNGPASESWKISENVWCASDRNRALTAAKLDREFETHACDASAVTRHFAAGQDVGLSGTPAIVFPDGTLLSGYLPPDSLAEELDRLFPAE